MTCAALAPSSLPTAVTRPPAIPTSWRVRGPPLPSTRSPFLMTTSRSIGLRFELFASRLSQQLARHAEVAGEQAAIHRQHGASDPGCLIRGQEHGRVGDVFRLPTPPQRGPLDEALEHRGVAVDPLLPDRCSNGARGDRVAPNPV